MFSRFLKLLAVGAAILAAAGCARTTQPGTVGVEREQILVVSSKEVDQAAARQYAKVIGEASRKGLLDRDPTEVQRVRTVASRLIAQAGVFRPDASGWKWETHVLTSKELNAWVMPGGKVAVYTGLIEKLKLSDDELAAVMGHEIAHALREHGRERISQQLLAGAAVGLASARLGLGQGGAQLVDMVAQVTFTLPYSRLHEQEADRIGVELAARAGYDPRAAVAVWQKMAQAGGGAPPEILSTHPSPTSRIKDLEVYSERVMPLYQAARRGS
jgi:predicted Zn-dependent protease